ncbi:MAG TPA: hypothetical protein VM580_12215 [Labilithrix sp.]|nr:hypothetical protein [Labilithrix sp.]
MDDDRIKKAVLGIIERSVDAHDIADVVRALARGPRPTMPESLNDSPPTAGATRLLTRIVLGDILDDSILAARPHDRTFPLRLFFGELGRLLATDAEDGPAGTAADAAFTLASGLNFFFRAPMDDESKMRVGYAASRQLYSVAQTANLDPELVRTAAPLLATLMSNELERVKFESVDHIKVFDSQLHERLPGSDPTSFGIVRPASFLCRVAANNTVKWKAEVLT